jgi:hypothetical protein
MKKQEQGLKSEVIQEMAEKGFSLRCPVCGEKKTRNSKTCKGCVKPGRAKEVDQAVYDYHEAIESPEKAEKIISRLSTSGWEAMQETIKQIVEEVESNNDKCPDDLIFEDLKRSNPTFANELCRSLVSTFRRRQRCRELVNQFFDIEDYDYDRENLIAQISEMSQGFSQQMIAHIVDEQARIERERILNDMKKLVKGKIRLEDIDPSKTLKENAFRTARQISKEQHGIFGYSFKKLIRAAAEEMTAITESLAKDEEEREKAYAEKRAKKNERKRNGQDLRKEILSRPRVDLWSRTGQKLFGFPVQSKDEAALLRDKTIVVLGGSVFHVVKSNGGHADLKLLNLCFSDPMNRTNELAEEASSNKPVKLNTIWVICKVVASEAIKVFLLTEQQINNKELISDRSRPLPKSNKGRTKPF